MNLVNSSVLSEDLKVSSEEVLQRFAGKSFHSEGATTEKTLLP